jgi:hypothetical protein
MHLEATHNIREPERARSSLSLQLYLTEFFFLFCNYIISYFSPVSLISVPCKVLLWRHIAIYHLPHILISQLNTYLVAGMLIVQDSMILNVL